MKSDGGGAGAEDDDDDEEEECTDEVEHLRLQVGTLHQVCLEMRREILEHHEELLRHREALGQVQELLGHREMLGQFMELREGIQAVLGSSKIISEIGDRTAELDLSLAGVSDNTARHGKAISTLVEQHKRTASTLDAVVRAVKRLAHSRSRSRGPSAASRGESAMLLASLPTGDDGAGEIATTTATTNGVHSDGLAAASGGLPQTGHEVDFPPFSARQGADTDRPRGHRHDERPDWLPIDGVGDGWDWPGGALGLNDDARLGYGRAAPLSERGALGPRVPALWGPPMMADEEPRYWGGSGSSSQGSETRTWDSRRSGRANSARKAAAGGASAEVASCVQGVLARIEEALTKLDSPHRETQSQGSGATPRPATPRAMHEARQGTTPYRRRGGGGVPGEVPADAGWPLRSSWA